MPQTLGEFNSNCGKKFVTIWIIFKKIILVSDFPLLPLHVWRLHHTTSEPAAREGESWDPSGTSQGRSFFPSLTNLPSMIVQGENDKGLGKSSRFWSSVVFCFVNLWNSNELYCDISFYYKMCYLRSMLMCYILFQNFRWQKLQNVEVSKVRKTSLFCWEKAVTGIWLASNLLKMWRMWQGSQPRHSCRGRLAI